MKNLFAFIIALFVVGCSSATTTNPMLGTWTGEEDGVQFRYTFTQNNQNTLSFNAFSSQGYYDYVLIQDNLYLTAVCVSVNKFTCALQFVNTTEDKMYFMEVVNIEILTSEASEALREGVCQVEAQAKECVSEQFVLLQDAISKVQNNELYLQTIDSRVLTKQTTQASTSENNQSLEDIEPLLNTWQNVTEEAGFTATTQITFTSEHIMKLSTTFNGETEESEAYFIAHNTGNGLFLVSACSSNGSYCSLSFYDLQDNELYPTTIKGTLDSGEHRAQAVERECRSVSGKEAVIQCLEQAFSTNIYLNLFLAQLQVIEKTEIEHIEGIVFTKI